MRRQDAIDLVGTYVTAWTAANGQYVGILEEVTHHRPWRARVRITGVLNPAQAFEVGRVHPRRGFRVGELIEVGGGNCKPAEHEEVGMGVDYAEAVDWEIRHLESHEQQILASSEDHQSGYLWAIRGELDGQRRVRERLQAGAWPSAQAVQGQAAPTTEKS